MLDLSMHLDSDLGIDSIKRVEILSALQERMPDAPSVKPEHLGTLHTLNDIANFLDAAPAVATSAPDAPKAADSIVRTPFALGDNEVRQTLLSVVAEKT